MSERPHFLWDRETRRKQLGLKPDIDRSSLARRVLFGSPLQEHEREFVARLVEPHMTDLLVDALNGSSRQKKTGRSPSTAAAVRRDEVAHAYFYHRAMWPRDKHKADVLPAVAKQLGVSTSYVDKAVRKIGRARRAKLKAFAAAVAKDFAEYTRQQTKRGTQK